MGKRILFAAMFFHGAFSIANAGTRLQPDLDGWLDWETKVSVQNMLANISPNNAAKGAVVASPSKQNPNYFKHWIRDAALTMDIVVRLYKDSKDQGERDRYYRMMMEYIDFSRGNQTTPNPSGGLGEPLFYANGSAFNQGWGRPQNDGPGIRAFVLTQWAEELLSEGKENLVREKLYRPEIPAFTVIKADLEYVAHHFDESGYDLWEEVRGYHFYTRMVQRRALIDGAKLAERLGDKPAADYYRAQATQLEDRIRTHFDGGKGYIVTTLGRDGGIDYKWSNLDASVILAVLHGDTSDGFFAPEDERVMSTAVHLANAFYDIYPINKVGSGVGIGRYPEDHYDGFGTSGEGNPWILLTNAFAQYYFRVGHHLRAAGQITITDLNAPFFRSALPGKTDKLKAGNVIHHGDGFFNEVLDSLQARGESYLLRTKQHTGPTGQLDEQMNRYTGFQQGAQNLTWSDASMITAAWEAR